MSHIFHADDGGDGGGEVDQGGYPPSDLECLRNRLKNANFFREVHIAHTSMYIKFDSISLSSTGKWRSQLMRSNDFG